MKVNNKHILKSLPLQDFYQELNVFNTFVKVKDISMTFWWETLNGNVILFRENLPQIPLDEVVLSSWLKGYLLQAKFHIYFLDPSTSGAIEFFFYIGKSNTAA